MGSALIECNKLARWYGSVPALTDVDLSVPAGITGLLGPNGAGKSTLLRILTGQISASSGICRILGRDPMRDASVFRDLGFCSEDDALFERMTAREVLTFLARLSGFERPAAKERVQQVLEITGMIANADRLTTSFSKGMRQRTRIAAALLHRPMLILLDEPMTGLDPVGRRDVLELLRKLAEQGTSVLFSSHILHEVGAVAAHIVVLNRGMVLAEGSLAEIRADLSDHPFTLSIRCSDARALMLRLGALECVTDFKIRSLEHLDVGASSAAKLLHALPSIVLESGIGVSEVSAPGESVEAVFQKLLR
ncbi:MAG: ABC transporter ATP-binding protein [Planctomycetes bacterium]|nr:ABC transporter ATP-binding protein [Planctomycetota bacterium]